LLLSGSQAKSHSLSSTKIILVEIADIMPASFAIRQSKTILARSALISVISVAAYAREPLTERIEAECNDAVERGDIGAMIRAESELRALGIQSRETKRRKAHRPKRVPAHPLQVKNRSHDCSQ
jgi:hypothetical protein